MGLPSFFKTPAHREFNYQPRYYDERKERLEERIKNIEQKENETDERRILQKGAMRGYFQESKRRERKSNIRLAIIIAALFVISYFLLYR